MLNSQQNAEFVRLWTRHGQRIYAYIITLVPNRADADEIYQEVSITLWEKFERFELGTSFQAWARAVALNKVRNFRQLRRHKTILVSPEFIEAVDQTVVDRSTTLNAQHQVLAECFNKLQPHHKELIERRYRPGQTPATVAQQVGRSVAAVYKSLSRIHDLLFDCVSKASAGEVQS